MQKGIATDSLNIRSSPKIDNPVGENAGNIIGSLAAGAKVDVVGISRDKKWLQINSYPDSGSKLSVARVWVYAQYIQDDVPVPVATGVRIGINALNRHEEVCYPAADKGCRFFMVLNNPGFASALKNKYPDAIVMVRRHWNRQMPSIDAAVSGMDGCHDARLIYTGVNEGDECGQGGSGNNINVDEIRRRAEFDIALARKIKEISGATYAAGTFSMGTPEFNSQAVCDAIRELYAPAYNSGLIWWDHHLYSPILNHIYQDGLIWYETRWQFLFTKCGFDPMSKSRVVSSETGEDEGGAGGFPAHGRNAKEVADWSRRFIEIQSTPLNINGSLFPSPFVGGALFQAGNREDWMGYNVERYYDELAGVWQVPTRTIHTRAGSHPKG